MCFDLWHDLNDLLCTGYSFFSSSRGSYLYMFYLFRIPVSTLAYVIPETCSAIFNGLKDKYTKEKLTMTRERLSSFTLAVHTWLGIFCSLCTHGPLNMQSEVTGSEEERTFTFSPFILLDQILESYVRLGALRLQLWRQLWDSGFVYLGKQSLFMNRVNTFYYPYFGYYQVPQYHAIRGLKLLLPLLWLLSSTTVPRH